MKAQLRLAAHSVLPGHQVIEIWYGNEFIGQVTGTDGPGVKILSKHRLVATTIAGNGTALTPDEVVVEISR